MAKAGSWTIIHYGVGPLCSEHDGNRRGAGFRAEQLLALYSMHIIIVKSLIVASTRRF